MFMIIQNLAKCYAIVIMRYLPYELAPSFHGTQCTCTRPSQTHEGSLFTSMGSISSRLLVLAVMRIRIIPSPFSTRTSLGPIALQPVTDADWSRSVILTVYQA